ncbi:hypothetical protein AMAG_18716 [Allomyces macrogynus ATCC 38327]|uniref:Uncharacterized protein n=1 Tax=Allomyces macrogynus (strain ATCC 38327) TaxID=578462 RepID=A0A0L0SER0_ALLM3|nr:hypothetical protein AMAG_18716 [Allomyces macrogynus ATCC 38327]|eukprot:KNE60956.1 hypothetical protein AMAG_18716 [Allomyces macrogynus ATCC 38327]
MRAGTRRGKIPERTTPYTSPRLSNAEANFRRRNLHSIGNKMLRLHEISSSPTFLVQLNCFDALAGVSLPNGGYEPGVIGASANPAAQAFGERLLEAITTPAMVRLAEMAVASAPGFRERFENLLNGVFRFIQYLSFCADTAGFTRADEYLAYADALSVADIGPPNAPVPAAETGTGLLVREPAAIVPNMSAPTMHDAFAELDPSAHAPTRAEVMAAIRSDARAQDPFELNSSPQYSTFGRGAHHLNVHDVAALSCNVHCIHSSTLLPPLLRLPSTRSKDIFVDWLNTNLPLTRNAVVWQALYDANIPARKWPILCAVPHPFLLIVPVE